MVELGEGPECARHHPAGVEEDQQTLLPLGLVLDGDRPAPPRGRGPRDRAWVIVGSVFAKSREEAARARDARTPLAGVIRQTAAQGDLVAADLAGNVIRSERSRRSRIDQGEDDRSSPDCDRAPGERFVKGRERERYRTQQDEREQAWKRDERESTGAPFARLDQRGTSRRARTLRSAASASTPSISASALRTTRCRSVGGTSDFTSSGVTKSRPSSAAAAFAACSKWTPARGLAPSWRSPDRRVSSTMRTM